MAYYRFRPGQFVKFTYRDVVGEINKRFKHVLVLHPLWQRKMHALDLSRMTPAQAEVIQEVMNPENKGKPHRIPLVNDILRRMSPLEDIKNPVSFYNKFVKPFLRTAGDVYRTYYPQKMSGVVTVRQTSVKGQVINPKPLFHAAETKPNPTTPTKPTVGTKSMGKGSAKPASKAAAAKPARAAAPAKAAQPAKPASRMDLIKQRAQAQKPVSRMDLIKQRAAARKKDS